MGNDTYSRFLSFFLYLSGTCEKDGEEEVGLLGVEAAFEAADVRHQPLLHTHLTTPLLQPTLPCCGFGYKLDPYSGPSWIRILTG